MNDESPRRRGFSYGVGWGSSPKPLDYQVGQFLARELSEEASAFSQAAWAHEMLVRDVRLAETDVEKIRTVRLLHDANERVLADRRTKTRNSGFRINRK